MNDKNKNKVETTKGILESRGLIYREFANGQLQIDTVNFWATSDKWYDTNTGTKGTGINSFLAYIQKRNTEEKANKQEFNNRDMQESVPDSVETVTDDNDLPW